MIPKYIFEQLIKENEQDFNEMSWIDTRGLLMISTQYLRILFYIGRTYPTTWDKHVTMVTSTITLQIPGAPDVVGLAW